MKSILTVATLSLFFLTSCAELQEVSKGVMTSNIVSQEKIADGLQQALIKGVNEQVTSLSKDGGFYTNELVRIQLPEELSKVENTLKTLGLSSLNEKATKKLNETAQMAVAETTPIVLKAIQNMSLEDAKKILLGEKDAATSYLKVKTQTELHQKFEPIVQSNFKKVGADKIWENLIQKYNTMPFTENANPNLTDYVTRKTLEGVYKMIELEEKQIRTDIKSRSTDVLKQVFALQDYTR